MTHALNLIEKAIEKVTERNLPSREQEIKRIIEALLFASNEALSLDKMREIVQTAFPIRSRELETIVDELAKDYQKEGRAFQIDLVAGGYLLRTTPSVRSFVELLYQDRRGEKLSAAATEVLAIIAYRSPITRREMEKLRGVDCSGTVASLLERGLIEAVGRKEAPGRPMQYGVTKKFLQHFGLKDLQELTL